MRHHEPSRRPAELRQVETADPDFANEGRRQSRAVAAADRTDPDLATLMDKVLVDLVKSEAPDI